MAVKRENWASKIGVILAVAGSAVGLGNFLRFPGVASVNGGGAFLIPYFIALIFLGIPLAWVEWTLGRYGGQFSHGSAPGVLNAVVRKPWAKYLGSLGIFGPMFINFYYIYVESWLLGYVWYSIQGLLTPASTSPALIGTFFSNYISLSTTLFGIPASLFFFLITLLINLAIVFFGVKKGIERASQIMMPVLLVLSALMMIRVLTLPNIGQGFAFLWNPDLSRLGDINVWFAASGQIFFTLSVGIGAILTYSSYVKRNQDVVLSSLTANATNEFFEVIVGGTLVIPAAIAIMGIDKAQSIASSGTFSLGFITMPQVLGAFPLAALFETLWFVLLFIAAITSSISLLQPGISFFEDEMKFSRRKSIITQFGIFFVMGLLAVFGLNAGAVDEMDFWAGNFALILFGTIEAVVFAWILGADKGWKEMTRGADIKLPKFFKFVLKYITPTYLIILLAAWFIFKGWDFITLKGMDYKDFTQMDIKDSAALIQRLQGVNEPLAMHLIEYFDPADRETIMSFKVEMLSEHDTFKKELSKAVNSENVTLGAITNYLTYGGVPDIVKTPEYGSHRGLLELVAQIAAKPTGYENAQAALLNGLNRCLTVTNFYAATLFPKDMLDPSTAALIAEHLKNPPNPAEIKKLNRFLISDMFRGLVFKFPRAEFMGGLVDQKLFIGTIRIIFVIFLFIINLIIFFAWKKYKLDDKLNAVVEGE
ncbi:MAG: sodium-dependent transporter [Brevinematales bacterium]|nr:sodium-dependent transporter [Brevinematales bacterium]